MEDSEPSRPAADSEDDAISFTEFGASELFIRKSNRGGFNIYAQF